MQTIEIIGAVITLIGSGFLFLGSLGLVRMPDLYTRIQTGTKASTLGTMLTLLGIGLIHLSWIGKIIVLILFVLLTNPISSHVLGRAAHYIKEPMSRKTITDRLQEDIQKEQSSSKEDDL